MLTDFFSDPGTTRTCDLLIRSELLYPTELRGLISNPFLYGVKILKFHDLKKLFRDFFSI